MKKTLIITIISAIITATAMLSGCGCESTELTATANKATLASETHEAESSNVTEPTLSQEEQAIVNSGLKVDDKGNIVDENGKKIETKDGKAEIKTADGKTVTVNTDEVKSANNKKTNNNNNNISSGNGSTSNRTNNNTSVKKPSSSGSSTVTKKPSNNGGSSAAKPSSSGKPSSSSASSSKDPHEGKTWHEAIYETKTTKVWVVDKEAYTYEEPVYETIAMNVCNDCGADVTNATVRKEHMLWEIKNGGKGSYKCIHKEVQIGTKTVEVPEEGHWETKTEKVLVREAGYY